MTLSESLNKHLLKDPRPNFRYGSNPNSTPDVWFDPAEVWVVKAADLSISPVHMGGVGLVDPNKGIALRFPRFLHSRDDKKPEDATSAEQLADMYKSQAINHTYAKNDEGGDNDEE